MFSLLFFNHNWSVIIFDHKCFEHLSTPTHSLSHSTNTFWLDDEWALIERGWFFKKAHDIFFICNKMNNSSALAVIIGIKKFEHFSMLLYFFKKTNYWSFRLLIKLGFQNKNQCWEKEEGSKGNGEGPSNVWLDEISQVISLLFLCHTYSIIVDLKPFKYWWSLNIQTCYPTTN